MKNRGQAPQAPPPPEPGGPVIRVATVDELFRAADAVDPGGKPRAYPESGL